MSDIVVLAHELDDLHPAATAVADESRNPELDLTRGCGGVAIWRKSVCTTPIHVGSDRIVAIINVRTVCTDPLTIVGTYVPDTAFTSILDAWQF